MEKKKFKFEFTLEETDLVLKAIQELPYRLVKDIVENIMNNYVKQSEANKEEESKE